MATLKKAVLVALAVVVSLIPVLAQGGHAPAFYEPDLVVPKGEEVPDAELEGLKGEADPLTIVAAMVVGAGIGAATDLFVQGVMIAAGWKTEVDWRNTAIATGVGAPAGPVGPRAVTVVRSAIVQGARWTVKAATTATKTVSTTAVKVGQKFMMGCTSSM